VDILRRENHRIVEPVVQEESIEKDCDHCGKPFLDNSLHLNKVFCDRYPCRRDRWRILAAKYKEIRRITHNDKGQIIE